MLYKAYQKIIELNNFRNTTVGTVPEKCYSIEITTYGKGDVSKPTVFSNFLP